MDSPLSPNPDADINNMRSFYFKIENDMSCPSTLKNKTTLVKYTKLPDYDFDSKGKVLQSSNRSSRTTLQDDKSAGHKIIVKSNQAKLGSQTTNRSSETNQKDNKSVLHRNCLKSPTTDKSPRVTPASKMNVKTNNITNKRDFSSRKPVLNSKQAIVVSNHSIHDNIRTKSTKDKEQGRPIKSTPRVNLSKNLLIPHETDELVIAMNNDYDDHSNKTTSSKRILEKNRFNSKSPQHHTVLKIINKVSLGNPIPVIRVPIDSCHESEQTQIGFEKTMSVPVQERPVSRIQTSIDCCTDMDHNFPPRDANVGTPPLPVMVNEQTETSDNSTGVFDNLDIPNVTLLKDKSIFAKEEVVSFCSRSMPNLKISPEKESSDEPVSGGKAKTYIIGRATFTYTTKQKINFHVVGSSDDSQSNQSPSPLAYPLNVMSLLKKKINQCDISESSEDLTNKRNNCHKKVDELQALACPDVFNNNKLVKPSDLISTIRVNNGLLHNDYICEQFQRELHFIDSFFESLQYLENCSLSEKCFSEAASDNWVSKSRFDLKNSEYNSFLSKLESGAGVLANVDDIETMASKSLCLLNLLIRNEQRRAKNLLFVLKMREDALKDFTKSQIIWLENKKKQDNTDVSTLKKKQRGALLKLQHECGEMQRMRKALLTLSERRKAALMKTRNSIELKLKNNVDVEQILLGKKKLKRNISADRNVAPLKCFDLSSSGCEESSSSKPRETPVPLQELPPASACAEKCVQTGDSICEPAGTADQATDTAAENFVAVDGAYLNIIFQNLSLPQIFSYGRQYEVNEEALRNILESSNKVHLKDNCDSDVLENFMDKIRNRDSDKSSSASTAHSLVDEFDLYYKGLSDRSKSPVDSPDPELLITSPHNTPSRVYELSESCVQTMDIKQDHNVKTSVEKQENIFPEKVNPVSSSETLICEQICICDSSNNSVEAESLKNGDPIVTQTQAGPLPVPPGAASPEPLTTDGSDSSIISFGSSIRSDAQSLESVSSSSGYSEVEELRRQQLAIEREIKALEQQQNQALVVREIPDKPPPPYTPPNNALAKTSRMFVLNDDLEEKIHRHIAHGEEFHYDPSDAFSVFIKDICEESLARQKQELSDQPWDACNLLPHQQELSPEKRGQKTISEVKQVLSGVSPPVVSGVGARRSDHIDDILFTEWRRCEPEWTSLHSEEAGVKAQVFESLFQKVLSETVDQYKQTVLGLITPDAMNEKSFRKKILPPKLGE
ncbi:uncharacterized protein LOC125241462 isoform X2 [Leguminivora glycinivorella]|uniref:uncharacterized protein LOC125241462 isoform X2 n=1 Tax=Leguminivora glycinivorella TaxID=1035111 RepID=UPI00200CF09F|nr:uncharacterized protein LOC125241462 isoform X2 [Leguminivora glycinivorella]